MKLTRKEFLKLSAGAAVTAGSGIPFLTSCSSGKTAVEHDRVNSVLCPFCAAGCSVLVYSLEGNPIFITGDKKDPATGGYLCSRAFSLIELYRSKDRLKKVQYRAPFSGRWEFISYEDAVSRISAKIKKTRDESFIYNANGVEVNRIESITAVAGANLTNEELFSFTRFCRILGIADVGTDHLIKSGSKNRILQNLLGYGAEPNPVIDIINSNIIIMLGADPAEDAGIYMHYIDRAKQRGAEFINIDILFTKSAVPGDHFVQIKPATDLVFLNAVIHFILNNDLFDRDYASRYTEAGNILHREFFFNKVSGLFSGFNLSTSEYTDKSSWSYELDKRGNPQIDEELRDSHSVLSILKNITSDYSPAAVRDICGIDPEQFLKIAEIIGGSFSKNKKVSFILGSGVLDQNQSDSIMHAVLIIQLLLGNIGTPGGGVYSVEKYGNFQSLNDFIPDWSSLPGNIPLPVADEIRKDLSYKAYAYNNRSVTNFEDSVNYYSEFENISSSLLRAFYGTDLEVEHVYKWLPKSGSGFDSSKFISSLENLKYKGAFFLNSGFDAFINGSLPPEKLLSNLEWAVVTSCFNSGLTEFWKTDYEKCGTEVFLFPSEMLPWKKGTVTNISRKIRKTGLDSDLSPLPDAVNIFADIHDALKSVYSAGEGAFPEPVNMSAVIKSSERILELISGYDNDKKLTSGFELNAESSISGNHLYSGIIQGSKNKLTDYSGRKSGKINGTGFFLDNRNGYTWPCNTVYLYNKISVDKGLTHYNADIHDTKYDVTDGLENGVDKNPFIMTSSGKASLLFMNSAYTPFPVYYDFIRQKSGITVFPFRNGKVRRLNYVFRSSNIQLPVVFINRSDGCLLNQSKMFLQINGSNLLYTENEDVFTFFKETGFRTVKEKMLSDGEYIILKNSTEISDLIANGSLNMQSRTKHIILNITVKS
ncbi:MAG: molybdopterin-dependent oxidoreductase [Spirochaetes bacterium]|nr:molybdopterin-dependent oxidoreductase [Spirochaetota bacterium]